MVTKKTKGLQILFMLMVLSLVACDSKPKYDDVIGYWQSTLRKDMVTGDAQICIFQKEYVSIGSNKIKYVVEDDADKLTLRLSTGTSIIITDYSANSVKISLPHDIDSNGDRVYFTYVPIDKEKFEKAQDEHQKRFEPIEDAC